MRAHGDLGRVVLMYVLAEHLSSARRVHAVRRVVCFVLVRIRVQTRSVFLRSVHTRLIVQLRQVGCDLCLAHLRDELLQLRIVVRYSLLALANFGQACG